MSAHLAKRNQAITRSTVETTPMITAKINFSSRNTSSRINRKSRINCELGIRLLPGAEGKECNPPFVTRNQGNWLAQLAIARRRKSKWRVMTGMRWACTPYAANVVNAKVNALNQQHVLPMLQSHNL